MKTSDSIDALAAALAAAQSEIRPALKDAKNPAFNSKYADIGAVFDAARPALAKHGLSVVQMPEHSDDALLHLTTRICHKSGQWIEGTMSIPVGKVNAHGYGSAITYARRYAFSAALGIVADEDDDGNVAATTAPERILINKERPISGAQVAKDALADMSPEEQDFIRSLAGEVTKHENMHAWIEAQNLDAEEKLALWSLLPSDVRSAIKKQAPKPQLVSQA